MQTAHPDVTQLKGMEWRSGRLNGRKRPTYPELVGPHSRAKLVVLAVEVGGRKSGETRGFLSELARAHDHSSDVEQSRLGDSGGERCSDVLLRSLVTVEFARQSWKWENPSIT